MPIRSHSGTRTNDAVLALQKSVKKGHTLGREANGVKGAQSTQEKGPGEGREGETAGLGCEVREPHVKGTAPRNPAGGLGGTAGSGTAAGLPVGTSSAAPQGSGGPGDDGGTAATAAAPPRSPALGLPRGRRAASPARVRRGASGREQRARMNSAPLPPARALPS